MAIVTRRYKLAGPNNAQLALKVGASSSLNASFPVTVADIDIDDAVGGAFEALDEFMAQFGFVFDAIAVPSQPFSTADKNKLDTVQAGATNTPLTSTPPSTVAIGDAASAGAASSAARSDHVHALPAPAAPANVTKSAAAAGSATTPARADHKHDVSTAIAVDVTDVTNAEGVSTSLSRADHTHAHGNRGGGTLHAVATPSVAGFMSAADKTNLDNLVGSGGGFDMRDIIVFDHFMSSNSDLDEMGIMGWRDQGAGTGSSISFSPGAAGRPGIVEINGGTVGTARRGISLGDAQGNGSRIIIGGTNPLICEVLVQFPTAGDFSLVSLEEITIGLGLDWNEDAELTNGVYFRYAPAADTFWSLVTANGGVRSVRASGTVPVAATWVRLGFSVTPGQAIFTVNGVQQGAALTTNIPTTGLGFGLKSRSAGSGACRIYADYVLLRQVTDKEGL